MKKVWHELPSNLKEILYKDWLYFVKLKGSLNDYLWDEYGAFDYFIARQFGVSYTSIEDDIAFVNSIITLALSNLDEQIINELFSMEFLGLDGPISDLSPLKYMKNLKVIDFHCCNESNIIDFSPLKDFKSIFVLDYSDYQLVNFDQTSNITNFSNITYIKSYGVPKEMNHVFDLLKHYNLE